MIKTQFIEQLANRLKRVLGLDSALVIDSDAEFADYGMNSIVSARFSHTLSEFCGIEVTPKVTVEYDTLSALGDHLWPLCGHLTEPAAPEQPCSSDGADSACDSNTASPDEGEDEGAIKAQLIAKILAAMAAQPTPPAASQPQATPPAAQPAASYPPATGMDFSFIFFSSNSKQQFDSHYDYVTMIAKAADQNGFKAIWIPERHFFEFGGAFPDPVVLLTHLATQTRQLRLRSGCVVLPLHHPANVVESWSMLDQLSNGRVDMGFASGWNPNDFVTSRDTFAKLRETWFERMAQVQRLWQGESLAFYNGKNQLTEITTYPRPVQAHLNIWMAVSGNPASFIEAGKRGYNILTMLTSKPVEELASNIQHYRQARADHGFAPEAGIVTLMLHTYVHEDTDKVDELVEAQYFDYIKSGLKGHVQTTDEQVSEAEINRIVEHSFHYQRKNSALFGDVHHCQTVVEKMRRAGVNEISCLLDFGISEAQMAETLPYITQLKNRVNGLADQPFIKPDMAAQPLSNSQPPAQYPAQQPAKAEYAIIGMAGRYPQAANLDQFWQNLLEQRNCISEIDDQRYDWQAVYGNPKTETGKTNIKHFGLLDDIYQFDSVFFGISKREGELMDPHARLLLQTVWHSIENAGYAPHSLNQTKTGLFVAFYNNEYAALLNELIIEKSSEPYLATTLSGTIKANRISYILGLTGPSEVYDTACSSSLVAMHRAAQSISAGDCDQAIVAGVSLLLTANRVVSLSKMGILNDSAICNPFSFPANKEIIGEGVGAIIIKPLAKAQADKDYIYAVISGTDVNHHGDLSGRLTMPSAKSLSELMNSTYQKRQVNKQDICYIEGHGSGNDSDVVELIAFNQCFNDTKRDEKVAVGSVKANIGFGEACGGMAQLSKCALALNYGQVPATIHFQQADPSFDLAASAIQIQTQQSELDLTKTHYMSIVAYGLGGSNAHILMRNIPVALAASPSQPAVTGLNQYPLLFSAASATLLVQYVTDIQAYFSQARVQQSLQRLCGESLLAALSQTLLGRERHNRHRLVLLVNNLDELLAACAAFLGANDDTVASKKDQGQSNIVSGQADSDAEPMTEFVEVCLAAKQVRKLAVLWSKGTGVDWLQLFDGVAYQRLALPMAPFNNQVMRLQAKAPQPVISQPIAPQPLAPQPLPPLAQRLRWTTTAGQTDVELDLYANDTFIAQHVVDGKGVLPAAAYLALLSHIGQVVFGLSRCTVKNLAWLMPFEVQGGQSTLALSFMASGQFKAYNLSSQQADHSPILCCKGQLILTKQPQETDFSAQLQSASLTPDNRLLDQQGYWALANSPESKQAHGPAMRCLTGLYRQQQQCVGELAGQSQAGVFGQIPVYDSSLGSCVGIELINGSPLAAAVPFAIEAFHHLALPAPDQTLYAVVSAREGKLVRYDLSIEDISGKVYGVCIGYFAKAFESLATTATLAPAPQPVLSEPVVTAMITPNAAPSAPAIEASGMPSKEYLINLFQHAIADFLKEDVAVVPVDDDLAQLGLDSIGINELTDQLATALQVEVPATMMFEYNTIIEMVDYLLEELEEELAAYFAANAIDAVSDVAVSEPVTVAPKTTPALDLVTAQTVAAMANNVKATVTSASMTPPAAPAFTASYTPAVAPAATISAVVARTAAPAAVPSATQLPASNGQQQVDVAVIGMGGMFPGGDNVHDFWQKIKTGQDLIGPLPSTRRSAVERFFAEDMADLPGLYGGFVDNSDYFDADFFGLSSDEVMAMDPQQRLFLVASWQAMEDAGYNPLSFGGQNVGVYVGALANEYLQVLMRSGFKSNFIGTGCALSGIANRTSYFFDFNGPSQVIDAACCSSLYTIDRAVIDIATGVCDTAIAGGVSYICTPDGFNAYDAMDYLADDWRCKAFAENGDGWSKAELFGAVFLKSHQQAVADGDHIYAVIKAAGVNHGGKSHFYEQPNSTKHFELISDVIRRANIDPRQLVHIEAHGTGTEMGDALEYNVISRAVKAIGKEQQIDLPENYCGLGSIKSNIGHGEAAAGIAGFIKSVMLLHDKVIPATLHVETVNKHIRLKKSPLYISTQARQLPECIDEAGQVQPRCASVHSFNFSGAAAHVLVAEHIAQPQAPQSLGLSQLPVCLSARTATDLVAFIQLMIDHLNQNHLPADQLTNFIYTLNCSRSHFGHRIAFTVTTVAECIAKFSQALVNLTANDPAQPASHRYSDLTGKKALPVKQYEALSDDSLPRLMDGWLEQPAFDWSVILKPYNIVKHSLPTYPFAKGVVYFPELSNKQMCMQSLTGQPASLAVAAAPPAVSPVVQAAVVATPVFTEEKVQVHTQVHPQSATQSKAPATVVARGQIEQYLRRTLARYFSFTIEQINMADKINQYPFESLTIVQMSEDINRQFSVNTGAPDFFAFGTLAEVVDYIAESIEAEAAERQEEDHRTGLLSAEPPVAVTKMAAPAAIKAAPAAIKAPAPESIKETVTPAAPSAEPIAIIGISGAFPGAENIEQYWQLLNDERNCISEIPANRWAWQQHPETVKWGGFMADFAQFDPLFFGISPREAQMMDPQQRLLLTHAWQCIEDAGYAPSSLSASNTAVILGTANSGFDHVLQRANIPIGGHSATGLSPSVGPNRVSFLLNLNGPSEPVDTACSSSLVAIHRGVGLLRSGESELVIAGGVNTILSPMVHSTLSSAGMLSADGACKTFSDQANGYARGEGIGIVLLKRLSAAEAAGDHIYGLIKGSAENHGGRANSLTAPNPEAQARLLEMAYQRAAIDPRTVSYIEAHGTGTSLGDPVEINGLKAAFKNLYRTSNNDSAIEGRCALGTVKSNIGHLEIAAGVAGILKVLLQMKHQRLVKSLHTEVLNPYIHFEQSPFYVLQHSEAWPALTDAQGVEIPRRAGVSSFGFGGVNAHVVLEQYVNQGSAKPPVVVSAPGVIVLSSQTEQQLQQQVVNLLAAVRREQYSDDDLARIAYTLQVGRDGMPYRLAFQVDSIAGLISALAAAADPSLDYSGGEIYRGKVTSDNGMLAIFNDDAQFQHTLKLWIGSGKLNQLLGLWVQGLAFDWLQLYPEGTPQRLSLPSYPFAKVEYWFDLTGAAPVQGAAQAQAPVQAPVQAPFQVAAAQTVPAQSAPVAPVAPVAQPAPAVSTPVTTRPKVQLMNVNGDLTSGNHGYQAPVKTVQLSQPAASPVAAQPTAPTPAVPAPAVPTAAPAAAPAPISTPAPAVNVISQGALTQQLAASLAEVLYIEVDDLAVDKPFTELGLDSILGVEWVRSLNQQFAIDLPVVKLYDYPTVLKLAEYLHQQLAAQASAPAVQAQPQQPPQPVAAAVAPAQPLAPVQAAEPAPAQPQVQPVKPTMTQAQVERIVLTTLAAAVYVQPDEIANDKPFVELGVDSIIAVEWVRALNIEFSITLPVTKLYDYPTVVALARYIMTLTPDPDPTTEQKAPQSPAPREQPVAVKKSQALNLAPVASMVQAVPAPSPINGPSGLVVSTVHHIDELTLQAWPVAAVGPGEITIAVQASAINFPDTMCVMGLYPTMPSYPFVPGFEVAGIITALGSEVSQFALGDEVIALTGDAMGGHAQYVNVPAKAAVRKPANLTFEQACSVAVAFGTVYAAFEIGKLAANEHLLVHTATGGCGLMALQLAHLQHGVCYATAGKDHKLALLKRLEVPYVMNYKTAANPATAFDQQIAGLTGGRGVDVVLNMLSGEAIQQGINCLAPSGRYLELAVHGLKVSGKLDLSRLVDNQTIHSMDFRRLAMADQGADGQRVMQIMVEMLASGQIVPIVSRIYPYGQVKEALSYVSQAQHIGKVVVSHRATEMVDCTEQCIADLLGQKQRALSQPAQHDFYGQRQVKAPGGSASQLHHDSIAVIGMAGRFPNAPELKDYWFNIANGVDCVTEIPANRWPIDQYYDPNPQAPGKSNSKWMGCLEDADKFDPLFFAISPAEALQMDPQQRLFLEACWLAIEDAAIEPGQLSGTRCGVFVGCSTGDYGRSNSRDITAQALMGGNTAILSARISYLLDLKGPCLAIDTACSASLVAISEACNTLRLGHCETALAGGVTVLSGPSLHISTAKAGMLSATGRCHTFDNQADGFVPGEGVGVILLKPLAAAQRDGDPIHGIIRGWGINQDGKTNGMTAPSANAQVSLEKQVYQQFDVSPETITLIEAHGTGTKLGDPIEVSALNESFRHFTAKENFCALGSVKSNIGHTLSAAGVAGVIKVLLAMKHQQLPPSIQFNQLNEHIVMANSPFYVNDQLQPWPVAEGSLRRAAVSAFAFNGTNAHMVVEQAPLSVMSQAAISNQVAGHYLVVLSARTKEQLTPQISRLQQHMASEPTITLADISCTLLNGRRHFSHRWAVVVSSLAALNQALSQWQSGESGSGSAWQGFCRQGQCEEQPGLVAEAMSLVSSGLSHGSDQYLAGLQQLADLHCQGYSIDFTPLTQQVGGKRVNLPGYPFARESYWLASAPESAAPESAPESVPAPVITPTPGPVITPAPAEQFANHFAASDKLLAGCEILGLQYVPMAMVIEVARQAAVKTSAFAAQLNNGRSRYVVINQLQWLANVAVTGQDIDLNVVITPEQGVAKADVTADFQLVLQPQAALVAQGNMTVTPCLPLAELGLNALQQTLLDSQGANYNTEQCYQLLAANGWQVEASGNRVIRSMLMTREQALVTLGVPNSLTDDHQLHDACILDGVSQGVNMFLLNNNLRNCTVVKVDSLHLLSGCDTLMWVWIRYQGADKQTINIDVCDARGRICIQLFGVEFSQSQLPWLNAAAAQLPAAQPTARSVADKVAAAEQKQWLYVASEPQLSPLAADIDWLQRLQAYGTSHILLVYSDEGQYQRFDQLLKQLAPAAQLTAPLHTTSLSCQQLLDASDKNDQSGLLSQAPDVVLFLGVARRQAGGAAFVENDIKAVFNLTQALMRKGWDVPMNCYYIYQADAKAPALDCEALSGLLSSAVMENSGQHWRLIRCDEQVAQQQLQQLLLQEWLSDEPPTARNNKGFGFSQVAYQQSERWLTVLSEVTVPRTSPESQNGFKSNCFKIGGCYVLTGGLGPMGDLLCRQLAARYQATLVILSRSPLDEAKKAQIAAIEAFGGKVEYHSVDITDKAALTRCWQTIKQTHDQINGMILLANQVKDGIIATKAWQSFADVIRTKVSGSLYLDELSADEPLDFVLYFSSIAAYGVLGSSDYAYASAFQNALANYRNSQQALGKRSGFAVSCCWGPWTVDYYLRQTDRPGTDAERAEKFIRQGTDLITIESAMGLIEGAGQLGYGALGLVAVSDREKFRDQLLLNASDPQADVSAFERQLEQWEAADRAGTPLTIATLEAVINWDDIQQLEQRLLDRLYRLLEAGEGEGDIVVAQAADSPPAPTDVHAVVANTLSEVLGLTEIDNEEYFQNYGMDSIVAMQLVTRLERRLARSISPAWLVEYPTVSTFSAHLLSQQ